MIRCIYETKAIIDTQSSRSPSISIAVMEVKFNTVKDYREFKSRYIDKNENRTLLIIDNDGHAL